MRLDGSMRPGEEAGRTLDRNFDPTQQVFIKTQTVYGRQLTSRIRFLDKDSFVLIKDNYYPQKDVDKEYFRRVSDQ